MSSSALPLIPALLGAAHAPAVAKQPPSPLPLAALSVELSDLLAATDCDEASTDAAATLELVVVSAATAADVARAVAHATVPAAVSRAVGHIFARKRLW